MAAIRTNLNVITCIILALAAASRSDAQESLLVEALRKFDSRVIVVGKVRENPLAPMLSNDARAGLRIANSRNTQEWEKITTRTQWETFRDEKIDALRRSLGSFPPPPKEMGVRVTNSRPGDGFIVENLVYQSRPGLWVAANLYRPAVPNASMPGIILVLSHQRPKHNGQRQDMAMTWARAGCVVLVPEHLGHGERAVHPFSNPDSYEAPFRAELQDYWFRYDLGMQLHLLGDTLMGWLIYDLSRGVDVLLAQKNVDSKRILLVSEPAGGGDVAAVAQALDSRIAGSVVTNFGGPQPETQYPLPRDAEQTFDYAGAGTWESTRCLTHSARDGFLPWTILASVAPRKLVYNHEFYWDPVNDPVWKRLQKIYSFYQAADSVAGIGARGFVAGSPPENWHWLPVNRALLYPTLERWFGIPSPKAEYDRRRPESELLAFTRDFQREMGTQPAHSLMQKIATERVDGARTKLHVLPPDGEREKLRKDWARLLGDIEPGGSIRRITPDQETIVLEKIHVERFHLCVEPGILVPVVLMIPPQAKREKVPLVVGVAQAGKDAFLKQRAETLAALLRNGVAVALPDVRGTGETSPGDLRDRRSQAMFASATGLMTGRPLLGARLRDLRSVLAFLRRHSNLDMERIALWGDSFTDPLQADRNWKVPHGIEDRPPPSEPLGGLLAMLGALFEDDVRAVYSHGGLVSFASALESPFCYFPHDVIVPGALTIGDLPDLARGLVPRSLRMTGMVDGINRRVARLAVEKTYEPTRNAYRAARSEGSLSLEPGSPTPKELARWLTNAVQ